MFYYFDQLTSTIDEARNPRYVHGDVVIAGHQTAGRGQRGRHWISEAGKNLMFSVVLDTSFLRAGEQFLLLRIVALALVDTLADHGLDARIKWANDIYIGDRKITGVLIDHSLGKDGMLARSGVGVGINVNQTEFDGSLPNPTSMALEAGRRFDCRAVLEQLHVHLMTRLEALRAATVGQTVGQTGYARRDISSEYHNKIYRLDTPAPYIFPDGTESTGIVRGVGSGGELMIEHCDGATKSYLFHEVAFVIENRAHKNREF